MSNTLTIADIKRRGMAAIEEGLRSGPVHIVRRNKPAAVILSEEDYRRLTAQQQAAVPGLTAAQWLLAQTRSGTRSNQRIDAGLAAERNW